MGKSLLLILSLTCLAAAALPALAQAPTVGNATITPLPAKADESYGVTDPYSRHQRLGNTTGIGNSALQTESATAESRTPPGRLSGMSATQPAQPELQYEFRTPTLANPALTQPSFESNLGGFNTVAPAIRTEPFSTNFSFGARRSPAMEGVHTGQQSFRNLW